VSTEAPAAATRAHAPAVPVRPAVWAARLSSLVFVFAVAGFFFASGAAGLIYQVAWVRILSLIFGVTVYAVSTVLAGFMAGLALGSYLAGRVTDRIRNPLRAYGLVERGIGACGLLTPRAFAALRDAYPAIDAWIEAQPAAWASGGSGGALVGAAGWLPAVVRFLLAFAILLVPTTLMGATLPVILKSSLVRGSSLGRSVSLLYAVNTFGAIAGTVAAGFYLIAHHGVQASIQAAAALNLVVGVAALALSLGPAPAAHHAPQSKIRGPAPAGDPESKIEPAGAWSWRSAVVLVAFGVSGLCALGYEVVWFRLLSLFAFENSTYAFTVMLATVLFGIAAGSYALGPLLGGLGGRINWWLVFALLEWGIGATAVLSVTVLSHIQDVVKRVATWPGFAQLARLDDGWMILAAFAAIVPSMFLSGMTFPVAAMLYAREGHDTSRRIGSLYAASGRRSPAVGRLVACRGSRPSTPPDGDSPAAPGRRPWPRGSSTGRAWG
jgi:spermidine synthase